jgi:hypothetical protein
MIDPFGKKGTVSWYTDDDGVMHVKLKASFAMYGADGQNVSKADLKIYKDALVKGIKELLTKKFEINGKKFDVTTDISAKIYSSEEKAAASGRDNIVEIGYDQLDSGGEDGTAGLAFGVKGENFDRMAVGVQSDPTHPGLGDPLTSFKNTAAHEFASHLLSGFHSPNKNEPDSLFQGNGNGSAFYADDFLSLFTGRGGAWDKDSPPRFKDPIPASVTDPFFGIGDSGVSNRRANNRNNNSPSEVYKWKKWGVQ